MILFDACYKLFRLTLTLSVTHCKLFKNTLLIANLPLICKPVILSDYIRFLVTIPSSVTLDRITEVLFCSALTPLIKVPITKDITMSKSFGSILNIKIKFGK